MEEEQVPPDPGRVVLFAVAFEGAFALAALGLGWLMSRDPLSTLEWTWSAAGWGVLAALPLLPAMVWCSRSPWGPCRAITQIVRQLLVPYFSRCTLLDFGLVSLAAGIGEELLFRGVVQAMLADWSNRWLALVVASLLFGVAHFITPGYVVFATVFGLYLGGLWIWQENLLAPIVAHAVYDFLALIYLIYIARK
jgi:membrane protease YdiL (CAAX protease family)